MYNYAAPKPIEINLCDADGLILREKAATYISDKLNITGAERGSKEEQGFGALAEIVIRNRLGMSEINEENHPQGCDIILPSDVKVDVKCRGGKFPFLETYPSSDDVPREAKHNFFARQVYDEKLETDIYVMSHLQTPDKRELPGTRRQRKWKLYVCGWVSKKRVVRDGVYLPRGSLTEQGDTWFTYRGQEIEFYNKNLNGFTALNDILSIDESDVESDEKRLSELNITSADALRIANDLMGKGILKDKDFAYIESVTGIKSSIKPILHPNQYFHLLRWLKLKKQITDEEINKMEAIMREEPYQGI
ncbi:MAG: hypothetical protein L0Y74_03045 [candidate division Zixibacteria bacterium]|nr:hypothetical protein [candidate division Zixibacteria bacterium]